MNEVILRAKSVVKTLSPNGLHLDLTMPKGAHMLSVFKHLMMLTPYVDILEAVRTMVDEKIAELKEVNHE